MKSIVALVLFSVVVLFSCTDRDDNLEGVQIRVENTTNNTFTEVVIDSLIFSDLQPEEQTFYQKYEGVTLPQSVVLSSDSLSVTITVDNNIAIDTTQLNLFTYRIFESNEEADTKVEVVED